VEVGEAQVQEATFRLTSLEQVCAKPMEEPDQDLSDRKPIGGQCP
jgi:hypothetical protein